MSDALRRQRQRDLVAVLLAILFSFLGARSGALIYSFITITLRANQNVTGLALAIFGTGAGQFIGEYMRVTSGGYVAISNELKAVFANPLPGGAAKAPVVGPLLFGQNIFVVYLGLAVAVVMAVFLNRSRGGSISAPWASPRHRRRGGHQRHAQQVPGHRHRRRHSAIGGMVYITTIAGCGGTMKASPARAGWPWRWSSSACGAPLNAIWGSILFGGLMILYLRLQVPFIPDQLYKILPYVVTVIVHLHQPAQQQRQAAPCKPGAVAYFGRNGKRPAIGTRRAVPRRTPQGEPPSPAGRRSSARPFLRSFSTVKQRPGPAMDLGRV